MAELLLDALPLPHLLQQDAPGVALGGLLAVEAGGVLVVLGGGGLPLVDGGRHLPKPTDLRAHVQLGFVSGILLLFV